MFSFLRVQSVKMDSHDSMFEINSQVESDDRELLNVTNFYLDEVGDSILNDVYDQYEASYAEDIFDELGDTLLNESYNQLEPLIDQMIDDNSVPNSDILLNQAYEVFEREVSERRVQLMQIQNDHDYFRANVCENLSN